MVTSRIHDFRVTTMPSHLCCRAVALPARAAAFTLVELLIALAIGAFLLTVGGVTVQSWLARYEQRNAAAALMQSLYLARGEALKRGDRVSLCPSLDSATCDPSGRWERGWLVFADLDGDGDRDAAEPIVRTTPPTGHGIRMAGNRPVAHYVSFTAWGHARLASGALQMGTFIVCRPGLTEIQVVLANGGRPRLQETATPCP
jgi:type IV fimbrial biogenesis protein FimT